MGVAGRSAEQQRRPNDGDVIVDVFNRLNGVPHALVYVRNQSHAGEYPFPTHEEAVVYARAWAARRNVRAWSTDNWYDFAPLEDFQGAWPV